MMFDSQEELSEFIEESKKREYNSQYNFINCHNGYRKGKMHLAIGPSSGGKSTLTRSLLIDFLLNLNAHQKIHVHLSEETEEEFLVEIGTSGISFEKLKQLKITSEQDTIYSSTQSLLDMIDNSLQDESIAGFFFDNITTSLCYMDKKTEAQSQVGTNLKLLNKKYHMPFILIGHTGGDSTMGNKRLIEMNDIRGSKSIVNLAEFMYILQPFHVEEERHNILRVVKHRGVTIKNPFFNLIYSPKPRMFVVDESIPFKNLKELYKNRNVL